MFALTEADVQLRILGCGHGPAGFNLVMTKRCGHIVLSVPTYVGNAEDRKTP
jgi:hypothetical protein